MICCVPENAPPISSFDIQNAGSQMHTSIRPHDSPRSIYPPSNLVFSPPHLFPMPSYHPPPVRNLLEHSHPSHSRPNLNNHLQTLPRNPHPLLHHHGRHSQPPNCLPPPIPLPAPTRRIYPSPLLRRSPLRRLPPRRIRISPYIRQHLLNELRERVDRRVGGAEQREGVLPDAGRPIGGVRGEDVGEVVVDPGGGVS